MESRTLLFACLAAAVTVAAVLVATAPGPAAQRSVPAPVGTPAPAAPGTLTVTSDPPGAEVWLDTDPGPSATTPAMLALSPITHPVMLRMSGYRDYVTSVAVRPGENATIAVALEPER